MRGRTALWMVLGAGTALWLANDLRHKQTSTQQWHRAQPQKALITGASSGIGAAFARVLAREGYDLILLARRKDRLTALAEEIQRETPAQVQVWEADLSSTADLEAVEQKIAALPDLDLLVNNAGFGLGGLYSEKDIQDSLRMVQVHVVASLRLARAALPAMTARHHGGIINVSSIAALIPLGGSTMYGSTKAFLNFFSESLQLELQGSGVRVQALCPGFTYTEFHKELGRPALPSIFWMEPEQVVRESLRGLRENQTVVIPGVVYKLLAAVLDFPLAEPFIRLTRSRITRELTAR